MKKYLVYVDYQMKVQFGVKIQKKKSQKKARFNFHAKKISKN